MSLFSKFGRVRLQYKISKYFSEKFNIPEEPIDEVQDYACKLIKKILAKPNTEMLQLPYEKIMYMHWRHITVKVGETDDRVVVMNGKYYYYFSLPKHMMEEIRKRFIRKLDMRKGSWESKFNTCAVKNLKNILGEVDSHR
jgi:hypothetical protein